MNAVRKQRTKQVVNHPGTWITFATGVISYFITQYAGDKIVQNKTVDNTNEQQIYQVMSEKNEALNHRIDLGNENHNNLQNEVDENYSSLYKKTEKMYKLLLDIDSKVDDLRALKAENKTENINLTTIE